YFSQSGDDASGNGSISAPWKSLDKAQSILNEYARATNSPGLTLNFRSGDVWRTPAVLRADIASIDGTRVVLASAPTWLPQPGFTYELRGGGTAERIEVRSYNPQTRELILGWVPISSGHTEVYFECALVIASSHVTVTAYQEPDRPARSKPRFTRFVPAFGWSDARTRGDALAGAYSRPTAEAVAWLRSAEALDENFRRVDAREDVDHKSRHLVLGRRPA